MSQNDPHCNRCHEVLTSQAAIDQHLHWCCSGIKCLYCEFSCLTIDKLDEHKQSAHTYCSPCRRTFDSSIQLTEHDIAEHNMCKICGIYLDNADNLENHGAIHRSRSLCPGCGQHFVSNSVMLNHLESDECEWGTEIDEEVYGIALEGPESQHYTCDDDSESYFKCPTCEEEFVTMGELFRHVEGDDCDEEYDGGEHLKAFLDHLLWEFYLACGGSETEEDKL